MPDARVRKPLGKNPVGETDPEEVGELNKVPLGYGYAPVPLEVAIGSPLEIPVPLEVTAADPVGRALGRPVPNDVG